MQFGVLALMVLWDAVCGELFEVLVTVQAHFCDTDARVLSGMQVTAQVRWWFGIPFGVLVDFRKIDGWVSWGVLVGVLFRMMVRAHFCLIDGRVLLGAFFGGGGGVFWRCWCASTAIWGLCWCIFFFWIGVLDKNNEQQEKPSPH